MFFLAVCICLIRHSHECSHSSSHLEAFWLVCVDPAPHELSQSCSRTWCKGQGSQGEVLVKWPDLGMVNKIQHESLSVTGARPICTSREFGPKVYFLILNSEQHCLHNGHKKDQIRCHGSTLCTTSWERKCLTVFKNVPFSLCDSGVKYGKTAYFPVYLLLIVSYL